MSTKQSETLRAKPLPAAGEFEIRRGKNGELAAKVRRQGVSGPISVFWGQLSKADIENAQDAIFIYELERANQARDALAKRQIAASEQAVRAQEPRPVLVPQVIVSLSPQGELQVELPSASATRRVVKLKSGHAEQSLKDMLLEQALGNIAIGQGGAPTKQQQWHRESHKVFPDSRCSHCIAEGRIKPQAKRQRRSELITKSKDVEVRRLAPIVKRVKGQPSVVSTGRLNVEDLDL